MPQPVLILLCLFVEFMFKKILIIAKNILQGVYIKVKIIIFKANII